jgi:hypothetical protein
MILKAEFSKLSYLVATMSIKDQQPILALIGSYSTLMKMLDPL